MRKDRNLAPENVARVRRLRRDMTPPEQKLWQALRHKRIGWKFRRQHPLGRYALDFYCPELKLCIEVDGEEHAQRQAWDRARDVYLKQRGIVTLRIPAWRLKGSISGVVDYIWHRCWSLEHPGEVLS
jgi:very-short-patch-repair endonuclease